MGTILKRSEYWLICLKVSSCVNLFSTDDHDVEIYDDYDFYQQLLKDLIASGQGMFGV